ncbi:hypothetical protein ABZ942_25440 [Nocardia sp. NPDC046473]|uniref:hypothetical protein n=1 Tax=Nocardia sp. NPDC046473 TaxID=3155733 RepID=UPI0033EF335F
MFAVVGGRRLVAVLAGGVLAVSLSGQPGVADSFVTTDGGFPPCVYNLSILDGGSGAPRPAATFSDPFTAPRAQDWCSQNTGTASILTTPTGMELSIPATLQSHLSDQKPPLVGDNAELLPFVSFDPGMTMATRIKVPDGAQLKGTTGWGLSNRNFNPKRVELAWFAWWGPNGPVSNALAPVLNVLNTTFFNTTDPIGFFIMVKRADEDQIRLQRLDPALLNEFHSYGIKLSTDKVDFFIDEESVGSFDNPPQGEGKFLNGQRSPLLFQTWIDAKPWPLPLVPEIDDRGFVNYMTGYHQGPIESTSLAYP